MSSEVHKLFYGIAFSSSFRFAISLDVSGSLGLSFGWHGQKTGAVVTPLTCAILYIHPYLGQTRDNTDWEKKSNRASSHFPGTTAPLTELKVYSLLGFGSHEILLQGQLSPLKFCLGGLDCKRMEKKLKNTKRGFLHSIWTLGIPFPALKLELEGSPTVCLVPISSFQVALNTGLEYWKIILVKNRLVVLCILVFITNLPAITYFPETSKICSMHYVPVL